MDLNQVNFNLIKNSHAFKSKAKVEFLEEENTGIGAKGRRSEEDSWLY